MCGISGIYAFKNDVDYTSQIEKMNEMISHRGPDNVGMWNNDFSYLGHTRLSIIDTHSHANQPFILNDEYSIVYNGEVYNYLEIKEELKTLGYSFNTTSDTEVLISAYDCWKEKCLEKLNGMFAFCIVNNYEKTFFIARDRLGIKPIYYSHNDNGFYVFSEPKQVILTSIIDALPNYEAIEEYLAYQFPLGNKTFFENVFILEPGQYGVFSQKDGLELSRYWSCNDLTSDKNLTRADAETHIKELLEDSVRLRLRSDVETGCYLSGGIDSTIVSTIASKIKNGIKTFTFSSGKDSVHDESVAALETSQKIGSTHIEESMQVDSFWSLWCKSVYHMDEPRVGYSLIPQMLISDKVHSHLKVVLGGQGGDELFWGYGWNSLLALSPFSNIKDLRTGPLSIKNYFKRISSMKELVKKVKTLLSPKKYRDLWFSMGAAERLKKSSLQRVIAKFPTINSSDDIKKFEIRNWLHALLHVEDRASMSASVESRVPILDHRVVEAAFSVLPKFSINGDVNKQILINAFKEYLPSIGKKKGYTVPLDTWLKSEDAAFNIKKILNNKNSFIYNFITFEPNNVTPKQVWMIISLEIWYKVFISKEISLESKC